MNDLDRAGNALQQPQPQDPTRIPPADHASAAVDALGDLDAPPGEDARHAIEQRLRWALQAAGGGAWDWDLTGGEAWWSPEMYALWGVAPGTRMRLDNSLALVIEQDRERLRAAVEVAIAQRTDYQCEFRIRHPQQGERWMASLGRLICDATGEPVRLSGLTFDITARKQADETLRQSEMRYRVLHEGLRDAFVQVAMDGHIVDCNDVYQQLLGYSFEELRTLTYLELTPARWHAFEEGIIREQIIPRGYSDVYEKEYARKDGTLVPVELRTILSRDAAGQPNAMWAIVRDITARKQAEAALHEADRRKDEFLATLAHELRNPLAPIRNAVEVMRVPGASAAAWHTARDTIDRQVGHLARLVDDLLDVSRLTRGQLALRRERVDLAAVLQSAVQAQRPRLDAARQRLVLALPPTAIVLDADPVRLAQIFANLLDNAAKYTQPGGTITVTVEYEGTEVAVTVADTGIGIAAEHIPALFEMFTQVGAATDRPQGGLGIGLALTRNLVALHGGCIEARSAGPGQGSTFVVRLPVSATPAEQPPPSAPRGALRSKARRILVADDNRDCAESLAMLLRLLGHEVVIAGDGREAVAAAERERPDTIVLDLGMPKLDGYGACRRIREHPWGKDIAIFALTGWAQESDRRQSREAGFDGHLVKPVELATLQQALETPRSA